MLVIRTAEELAHALGSPIDPELKRLLLAHRDRLAEYCDFDPTDLAEFVVIEPHDTIGTLSTILPIDLARGGVAPAFSLTPEYADKHNAWVELVVILSDDGFGQVLLIPLRHDIDPLISDLAKSHIGQAAAN